MHFAWETRDPRKAPAGTRDFNIPCEKQDRRDPTRVPPGPTRSTRVPFLEPGPTPCLGSKSKSLTTDLSLAQSRLFPVRYLLKTQNCVDSSHRTTVGTTASTSHRNVTDAGRLQTTRTSRNCCDKKSCRCSTRGKEKSEGKGAKSVPD